MNPIEAALRGGFTTLARVLGSRGVISEWTPNAPASYGQPRQGTSGDIYGQITPQRMRDIVLKTPTVAGAMNAALDYASGVKVKPRNTDPSLKAPVRASKFVTDLLTNPNKQEDEREFRRKLLRDLFSLGFAAVEIEPTIDGSSVANMYVLDGANVRLDYDAHGVILGYDQLDVYGKPILGKDGVHSFLPGEVIYYQLDPRSESKYPLSRITQLFAAAVIEQLMLSYIGGNFTDSNVPFGVMDLGDINEVELKTAIALWNQQVSEQNHPEHRILMTGSKGGANWMPFGKTLKELEAPMLLQAVRGYILGILGVTANEMGEGDQITKSNGFNLSYTFKKRVIEPLLDVYVGKTTHHLLHKTLGYYDLELYYEEIDSRDELLQGQIDKVYLDAGVISINLVRNRKGLPSTDGGDEPTVNIGAAQIPVSMLREFAEIQRDALKLTVLQAQVGIQQALQAMQMAATAPQADGSPAQPLKPLGSLPLMRMMQPPERFTTPDATGSSSFKLKLPNPGPVPTHDKPSSAPRGPVEAAQRAGARKDQTHG